MKSKHSNDTHVCRNSAAGLPNEEPRLKGVEIMQDKIDTWNGHSGDRPSLLDSTLLNDRAQRMKTTLLVLLDLIIVAAPMAGTAQVQSVVAGNTAFALNLYSQLATNSGNMFFSPYSISTCLAMLYAGAGGDTEQQMSQVLGFGTNQEQFASLFGELQAELQTDLQTNAIELNIANALWVQEGFPFLPAFLETATNQYQANVKQADFVTGADAATQAINDWVAQETQNKILNIVPPGAINADTLAGTGQRHIFPGQVDHIFCGNQHLDPAVLPVQHQLRGGPAHASALGR